MTAYLLRDITSLITTTCTRTKAADCSLPWPYTFQKQATSVTNIQFHGLNHVCFCLCSLAEGRCTVTWNTLCSQLDDACAARTRQTRRMSISTASASRRHFLLHVLVRWTSSMLGMNMSVCFPCVSGICGSIRVTICNIVLQLTVVIDTADLAASCSAHFTH